MKNIIALPKGRLYKKLENEFRRWHQYRIPDGEDRTYYHKDFYDDASVFVAKPKAIPQLLHCGFVQYGITGYDIVQNSEYAEEIVPIYDFGFNKVKMCLCSRMSMLELMSLSRPVIVATEFPILAARYFTEHQRTHYVIDTTGSTEGYVDLCADCIIDVVETGETIKANGMEIIDELFETSTQMFTLKSNVDKPLPECIKDWMKHVDRTLHVYVEGNDGTGKTWLIEQLKQKFDDKVIFHDRCILSELTLDDSIETSMANDFLPANKLDINGLYVILDDDPRSCQQHIRERGDSCDEEFHTIADLLKYGKRYMILDEMLLTIGYNSLRINKQSFSKDSHVSYIGYVIGSMLNNNNN